MRSNLSRHYLSTTGQPAGNRQETVRLAALAHSLGAHLRSTACFLAFLLPLGCTPDGKESKNTSESSEITAEAEEAQPRVDLRPTFVSLEGYTDDGEYEAVEGTYFYEDDDHLFYRSYEGTRSSGGITATESISFTLDADGFPTGFNRSLNDEYWYSVEYVCDKDLFVTVEAHVYCYYSGQGCDPTLPEATSLYEYDDAGHLLAKETFYYFAGTKDVQQYGRIRYLLQESALPGTKVLSFKEEDVQYTAGGSIVYASKTVFSDDGMPVEAYVDSEGTGDFSLWYVYEVTQDSAGRPVRIKTTSDDPSIHFDRAIEYSDDGLLSAYIITEPSDEDLGAMVATRTAFTWHENPANPLRPGRFTTYMTIDGEPSEPWNELEWTVDSYVLQRFDVSGEEIMTTEVGLELVELPGFDGTE